MTRFYGRPVFGVPREILVMGFAEYFGVQPVPARILLALFAAAPRALGWRELAVQANSHRLVSIASVHQAISALRGVMEVEAIDSDRRGYWLSEVGVAECRRCMDDLARRIAAMSRGEAA